MSSLDGLLNEVGPILGSSQFSHPSFREVLAARQLADEINSERLSVKHAVHSLWLYDPMWDAMAAQDNSGYCDDLPYGCYFEPKGLRSEWRPALAHLAGMLNADKAREFVDVVGDFHKDNISSIMREPSIHGRSVVLEDFALCARFIGEHPALHENERVKQILDGLLGVAGQCSTSPGQSSIDERSRSAKTALSITKSSYAAMGLINYIISCGHEFHGEYDYNAQDGSKDEAIKAVDALVKSGVKIDENSLIKNICRNSDLNKADFVMLNRFCGIKSIEHIIKALSRDDIFRKFGRGSTVYYECISVALKEIQSQGFKPELIVSFNNTITEAQNGTLMYEYHHALFDFAKHFNWAYSTDLYKLLEKNKMQFWDYWMVYKPK